MALKQHLLLALEAGTVYPVTLKSVNPLSFSSQKSKIAFLKNCPGKLCKTYLQRIGYVQMAN